MSSITLEEEPIATSNIDLINRQHSLEIVLSEDLRSNHEIQIFNQVGSLIMRSTIDSKTTIDISLLPAGIYYLRIQNRVVSFTKF